MLCQKRTVSLICVLYMTSCMLVVCACAVSNTAAGDWWRMSQLLETNPDLGCLRSTPTCNIMQMNWIYMISSEYCQQMVTGEVWVNFSQPSLSCLGPMPTCNTLLLGKCKFLPWIGDVWSAVNIVNSWWLVTGMSQLLATNPGEPPIYAYPN